MNCVLNWILFSTWLKSFKFEALVSKQETFCFGHLHFSRFCRRPRSVLRSSRFSIFINFNVMKMNEKLLCLMNFLDLNLSRNRFLPIIYYQPQIQLKPIAKPNPYPNISIRLPIERKKMKKEKCTKRRRKSRLRISLQIRVKCIYCSIIGPCKWV